MMILLVFVFSDCMKTGLMYYIGAGKIIVCARLAKRYGDRLEITHRAAVVHSHSGVRIPYLALSIRVKTPHAKYG